MKKFLTKLGLAFTFLIVCTFFNLERKIEIVHPLMLAGLSFFSVVFAVIFSIRDWEKSSEDRLKYLDVGPDDPWRRLRYGGEDRHRQPSDPDAETLRVRK